MINKVITNDIYLLIVRSVLREGTKLEYLNAKDFNKPKLIYFIETENKKQNQDVLDLKKTIENDDLCLYKTIKEKDYKKIPKSIVTDLQNDVVVKFKEYIGNNSLSKNKINYQIIENLHNDYLSEYPEPSDSIPESDKYIKTLIYYENNEKRKIVSKNPLIVFYDTVFDKKKNLFLVSEPYLGKTTEFKALYTYCSKSQ